jgi:hypothetical protein
MNKQVVGLSPPFRFRPQTQVEKEAVAARKVQRRVKKRAKEALREVLKKAREVQREVKQTLDDMVKQTLDDLCRPSKRAAEERWHKDIHGLNGALQAENKRRQSGRWHKNYYGQWEKWTERQ